MKTWLKQGLLPAAAAGALLLPALWGLAFTLAASFSLDVDRTVLGWGCLCLGLAFLVIVSLPRWRWIPLLAAAGTWGLILWRCWDTLVLGEISMRCSVVNTFAQYMGSVSAIHPIAELPAHVWTASATLLALVLAAPVALLCAWALVRLRSAALFFWFTFPLLLPALTPNTLPDLPPLLVLLCAWMAAWTVSLAVRGKDRTGGALLTLLALGCAGGLLLGVSRALPADSYQRPQWADRAREELSNWASRHLDRLLEGDGPGVGGGLNGSSLADADGGVDLSDAGPLRYTGRTVLKVEADLTGRIYLRGFSGAVYEGNRWAPLPDGDYAQPLPASALVDSASWEEELQARQPMNYPAWIDRETHPEHQYVKFTVENVGADPGFVYYPYQILTTPDQLGGAAFVHDAYLARAEDVWTHTLYVMPECGPGRENTVPESLQLPELSYRAFAHNHYRDVPEELREPLWEHWVRIQSDPEHVLPGGRENEHYQWLVGLSSGKNTPDDLEMAALVADYLSFCTEYDPDTPATPEGEDFVTYFLTESRRGYCMHYASAAVLLLRSVGIPARYVSGYVADMRNGRAAVPDSNAHAWVEIYLNGYGWEPVEVTPAYLGGTPGRSVESTPTPAPSAAPTPTPAAASTAPRPSAAPTPTPKPDGARLEPDPRVLGAVIAVAALLAALPLGRSLLKRRRAARFRDPDPNRSVIWMYRCQLRLGRWGTPMDPELETLAQKAKFSQHILTEDERARALAALRRTAGETAARLPRWKRLLFRYLWDLE